MKNDYFRDLNIDQSNALNLTNQMQTLETNPEILANEK